MPSMRCEPANSTIKMLGGLTRVSERLCKNVSTVARWRKPKEMLGTDGNIPREYWEALYEMAKEQGKTLTLTDLVACPEFLTPEAAE